MARLGQAEHTDLKTESVDRVMACLTIHHWHNLKTGFKELYRVLKKGGIMVIFTATPKQMNGYWLNHYFPNMLKDSMFQMPSFKYIQDALSYAGFSMVKNEAYSIKPNLEHLFLYAGKHYGKCASNLLMR